MASNRLSWPLRSCPIDTPCQEPEGLELERMPENILRSRASPDMTSDPVPALEPNSYDQFSPNRKKIILAVLSYSAFISPMSSTTILSSIPEIAADYSATPLTIEMSNALYILAMGIAPVVWAPLSSVYGRRWVGRALRNIPSSN